MAKTPRSRLSRRALLAAPLALAPALAPALARPARPKVVTILGDSITAGLGLPAQAALPAQLQLALRRQGLAAQVRGAGVSGDTTAAGASRVDFSVQPDTAVAVVALGGNDLLQGIDPRVSRANLERIIRRLQQRRIAVVLVGLQAPPEIGQAYARDFSAVFPSLARQYRLAFYPDLLAGVARNPALKQSDGLHPNAAGVQVIASRLAPVVARAIKARG